MMTGAGCCHVSHPVPDTSTDSPRPNGTAPDEAGATSLTHFDASGQAHMVDVAAKPATHRVARATGSIRMEPATLALVARGQAKKGDVLGVARIAAKKEGRAIRDGEVVTACQQACPAEAITFGNILDDSSSVSKLRKDPRNYTVLGFLDIRPRVTYLARVRNPNPAIAKAEGRGEPDSLRDYERFRHESPFEQHGHGEGQAPEKHAGVPAQKGDA